MNEKILEIYKHHAQLPYISPDRSIEEWLATGKPVPKRNMEPLGDDLLAGDIILLWLVSHGTFYTTHWFPKYFEYTYGINAPVHLEKLVARGFVIIESAFDSLNHISSPIKKSILKDSGVTGLSKMKVADLDQALRDHVTEDELGSYFVVRGYALTEKGREMLVAHQSVVDRHPQKKF